MIELDKWCVVVRDTHSKYGVPYRKGTICKAVEYGFWFDGSRCVLVEYREAEDRFLSQRYLQEKDLRNI